MELCICGHSRATHHPDACGFMCTICNGKFILAEEKECTWCNGKGKRIVYLNWPEVKCVTCQGTGRVNRP